ncbi:hypothetical protein LCGC14_2070240 [marine sediment metagenome]|uniref:Uncharacterized protein n=1 Tax=marine sediment metagenome TaxID=412755 RepID=A0A0F9F606_9ZZZZ
MENQVTFAQDMLGHIGYFFVALGMLLLAKKSIWGWVSRFIGEATWLVVGVWIGMSSIWTWGIIFLFIEIYGFRSWYKDRKLSNDTSS